MTTTIMPDTTVYDDDARRLHPTSGALSSIAILSTFPPTQCGLATFAAALHQGLCDVGVRDIGVIDAGGDRSSDRDPRVSATLVPGSARSRIDAARRINTFDTLVIQHEFGIFGGADGGEVLDLLDDVHVPVIVTLHTVPSSPTFSQRMILEELGRRAMVMVVMTEGARSRLLANYDVTESKVVVIPHGATVPRPRPLPGGGPIELLTWGLLGPGKGVEWVIDALAMAPELRGKVRYTIAGQTHPKVLKRDGESYREMLRRRSEFLGVDEAVIFDNRYRTIPELLDLIQDSHCVILPYESEDQITSGVLVDALVAGRPVIATQFPHAVELLSHGAGLTVPQRDPVSLAQAIRHLAQHPSVLSAMANATVGIAEEHSWINVARQYSLLTNQPIAQQQGGRHGDS